MPARPPYEFLHHLPKTPKNCRMRIPVKVDMVRGVW
jgi:hypothetical protein